MPFPWEPRCRLRPRLSSPQPGVRGGNPGHPAGPRTQSLGRVRPFSPRPPVRSRVCSGRGPAPGRSCCALAEGRLPPPARHRGLAARRLRPGLVQEGPPPAAEEGLDLLQRPAFGLGHAAAGEQQVHQADGGEEEEGHVEAEGVLGGQGAGHAATGALPPQHSRPGPPAPLTPCPGPTPGPPLPPARHPGACTRHPLRKPEAFRPEDATVSSLARPGHWPRPLAPASPRCPSPMFPFQLVPAAVRGRPASVWLGGRSALFGPSRAPPGPPTAPGQAPASAASSDPPSWAWEPGLGCGLASGPAGV